MRREKKMPTPFGGNISGLSGGRDSAKRPAPQPGRQDSAKRPDPQPGWSDRAGKLTDRTTDRKSTGDFAVQPGRQSGEREPVRCPEERRDAEKPAGQINPSSHRFGEFPDESILRPKGHSRIDCSVRIIKKSKTCIDLTSRYGTLRLTPVEPEVIRVQFLKGPGNAFRDGYWNYRPKTPVNWTAKAGKTLVEVATEKLKLRMDKRNGALQFYDSGGKLLLSEKPELPRQIETGIHPATWTYFDWAKSEKLSARGNLSGDLERMNQKARYISFGGRNLRMPLLVSDCGYGLGIAAEKNVICCTIPTYGKYVYTDGSEQIDYYFLCGGDYSHTLELYRKIAGNSSAS